MRAKELIDSVASAMSCIDDAALSHVSELIRKTSTANSVFIFGNGGSLTIGQHFIIDMFKNTPSTIHFYTDPALITCFANDYGYENYIEEILKRRLVQNDLVILISSSGNSLNMINAAKYCSKIGAITVSLTGFANNNSLREISKYNFWVDSSNYNVIEATHNVILLALFEEFKHRIDGAHR